MDSLLDKLDPIIAEALVATILGLGGWVGTLIRSFFKTKESREALHSALLTGTDYVSDELAEWLMTTGHRVVPDKLIEPVIAYVKGSVPGAVSWLKPNDEQLTKMARSYLNRLALNLN